MILRTNLPKSSRAANQTQRKIQLPDVRYLFTPLQSNPILTIINSLGIANLHYTNITNYTKCSIKGYKNRAPLANKKYTQYKINLRPQPTPLHYTKIYQTKILFQRIRMQKDHQRYSMDACVFICGLCTYYLYQNIPPNF